MSESPGSTVCTLEQTRTLIEHHLDLLWRVPERARVIPPLMLWGPPGVGKSAIVRTLCEERGIQFIDVRLAQREPIDIRGLPVPRDDSVHWLLPAEWPRDPASKGIILFDELTAADRTLQVAAYEFILDRRLGDLYEVPDGFYVMAAGNRTSDRAVATTLSSALANRFCHFEVEADLEVWVRWAQRVGVHPEVIGFLRFRPSAFFDMRGNLERGWPSPRSWERVGLEIEFAEGLGEDALRALVHGLVGPGAGTEFLAFRRWTRQMPHVERILAGQAPIEIPERADQRYALCTGVVHYLWRSEDAAALLRRFFEIGLKLPSDFAAMMMVDALNRRPPEQVSAVLSHPLWKDWSKLHGGAFLARRAIHADTLAKAAISELGGAFEDEDDS